MVGFSGICVEITEALCVYLASLERSSTPELIVTIEPKSAALGSYSCHTKCKIQVNDIPVYFLDGKRFLQKLASLAKNFREFSLSFHHLDVVQVVCCRHSPYCSSIARYRIQGWDDRNQHLLVNTSMEQEVKLSPTNSIAFTIAVPQSQHDPPSTCNMVKAYLQLVHVVNPKIYIKYRSFNLSGDVTDSVDFTGTYRNIARTPFKLSTSLHNYLCTPNVKTAKLKLRLLRGGLAVFPLELPLEEGTISGKLSMTCFTSLVPSPPSTAPKLFIARGFVSHVHVNIFGPAMVPLLIHNSLELFLPSLWADWARYGIQLEIVSHTNFTGLIPSFAYKVKNTLAPDKRVLHIFLFLEYVPAAVVRASSRWEFLADMMGGVRETFYALMSRGSEKIMAAIHAALNKFLFNFSSNAEVQSRMERALPVLAEAVASIVHHSSDGAFKNRAKEMLQVAGDAEQHAVKDRLQDLLSKLANVKLGLKVQSIEEHLSNAAPSTSTNTSPALGNTADQLGEEGGHLEELTASDSDDFCLLSDPKCVGGSSSHDVDTMDSDMGTTTYSRDEGTRSKDYFEDLSQFCCCDDAVDNSHSSFNNTLPHALSKNLTGRIKVQEDHFTTSLEETTLGGIVTDFENTSSTLLKDLSTPKSTGKVSEENGNFNDLEAECDVDTLSSSPTWDLHEVSKLSDEKMPLNGFIEIDNGDSCVPDAKLECPSSSHGDQSVPDYSPSQRTSTSSPRQINDFQDLEDFSIADNINKENLEDVDTLKDIEEFEELANMTEKKLFYSTEWCGHSTLCSPHVNVKQSDLVREYSMGGATQTMEEESDNCGFSETTNKVAFESSQGSTIASVVMIKKEKAMTDFTYFEEFDNAEMEESIFEWADSDCNGMEIIGSSAEIPLKLNVGDKTSSNKCHFVLNMSLESGLQGKLNKGSTSPSLCQLPSVGSKAPAEPPNISDCHAGLAVGLRKGEDIGHELLNSAGDEDMDFCLLADMLSEQQEAGSDFSDLETFSNLSSL